MSEAALQSCVKATDLELAAAEEEELASGSESDSDDDEPNPGIPTAAAAAGGLFGGAAAAADGAEDDKEGVALTPDHHGGSPEPGSLATFRGNSAAAIKQIRAPIEAFFKRRGSMSTSAAGGPSGSSADGGGDRRAALLAALQGGGSSSSGSSLQPGRYIVEVDSSGERGLCVVMMMCGAFIMAGVCIAWTGRTFHCSGPVLGFRGSSIAQFTQLHDVNLQLIRTPPKQSTSASIHTPSHLENCWSEQASAE
jgi:hypothetical protein